MNRLVYLFELDSVRTEEDEINEGQRAVINEIAECGNSVVLTMNQLTDSFAFTNLLKDEKIYSDILSLFESKALRVSLFGSLKTPSQYMRQSLGKCAGLVPGETFKFSSLPIAEFSDKKNCNKRQYERIIRLYDAFANSDLSELKDYIRNRYSELDTLSGDALEQAKKDITENEHLLRFTELILKISMDETANIQPKKSKSLSFVQFMEKIQTNAHGFSYKSPEWKESMASAVRVIKNIDAELDKTECGKNISFVEILDDIKRRIDYEKDDKNPKAQPLLKIAKEISEKLFPENNAGEILNAVRSRLDEENETEAIKLLAEIVEKECEDKPVKINSKNVRSNWVAKIPSTLKPKEKFLANLLINLCYNYTLEDSIDGASKHYADYEDGFLRDLENRISVAIDKFEAESAVKPVTKRHWSMCRRVARFNRHKKKLHDIKQRDCADTYEKNFVKEKIKWAVKLGVEFLMSIALVLFYFVLFVVIETTLSGIEGRVLPLMESYLTDRNVTRVLSLFIFGIVSSVLSKKIPDVFQCFVNLLCYVGDIFMVIGGRYESYRQNK